MLTIIEKEKLQGVYTEVKTLKQQAELGTSDFSEGYASAMSFVLGMLKLKYSEIAEFEKDPQVK